MVVIGERPHDDRLAARTRGLDQGLGLGEVWGLQLAGRVRVDLRPADVEEHELARLLDPSQSWTCLRGSQG
jgi:hypothetical protein